MSDYFAVLGLPRRPLINIEDLKSAYHRHSVKWHPDSSSGDAEEFRKGSEAYETLLSPAWRLKHLQSLCWPEYQSAAPSLFPDAFMQVASALQKAQEFRKRKEGAQSALAKALLAREAKDIHQRLVSARDAVRQVRMQLEDELTSCDRKWPDVSASDLARLSAGFRFVSRWLSELEEADFSLSHGVS